MDTQEGIQSDTEGESGIQGAESGTLREDSSSTPEVKRADVQKGLIEYTRPILAICSIFALVIFYIAMSEGCDVPVQVNGFWAPVMWYFTDRTLMHKKKGDL